MNEQQWNFLTAHIVQLNGMVSVFHCSGSRYGVRGTLNCPGNSYLEYKMRKSVMLDEKGATIFSDSTPSPIKLIRTLLPVDTVYA